MGHGLEEVGRGVRVGQDAARGGERRLERGEAVGADARGIVVQYYGGHNKIRAGKTVGEEMFKAVVDRMPEGITLTAFQYKRGANVHVTGEAEQPTDVYRFKESFDQITVDDEPVFADVRMPGVSGRGGKNKFDIDASFESEEEK